MAGPAVKLAPQAVLVPAAAEPRPAASFLHSNIIFRVALAVLVFATLAAFLLNGVLAWTVGLIYIAYDSWLLWYMVRQSGQAVRDGANPLFAPFHVAQSGAPKITVLVSAYNELLVLPGCIAALEVQSDRPDEVIIVDDGSSDASIEFLTREYRLEFRGEMGVSRSNPRFKVLRKAHSGKADSLNRAWPLALGDVVLTLDADTMLDMHAIEQMRAAFAADPQLASACGVLTPKCRGKLLGRLFEFYQGFEYYRAFLWRLAWTSKNSLLLVSGAFAAYRKDVLAKLGGYDTQSLVEDYELVYRVHKYAGEHHEPMRVEVIGSARATTDAPAGVRAFLHQRSRWFSGFLQTLAQNADMVGKKRYGRVGRFMLPIKTVDTLLPVYASMSAALLVYFLITGGRIDRRILAIIGAKLVFDLIFHCRAIYTYQRWQGEAAGKYLWAKSLVATLTEPFAFQLLRHSGALLGWVGFVRGRSRWAPQRETPDPAAR